MIRTSESVSKIAPALLKVQQAISTVEKGADNPFFKSKFADLQSVMDAVKEPLNDNGIVVLQFPSETNTSHAAAAESATLGLTTRLQHTSGEFIEATAVVPLSKSDPQAYGSAITYARRYSLQAAIGLLAVDDDGEGAVTHAAPVKQNASSGTPAKRKGSLFLSR